MWITFGLLSCFLSAFVALILVATIHCRGSNGEQVVYCKGTVHTESEICICVCRIFHICHPFLSKCLLRMQKCRKSNLVWFILWQMKVSKAVCKRDTTWGRIYFSTCEYFGLSPNLFWSRTTSCITCMEQTLQSKSKNPAVVHCYPHDRQTKSNLDSNTVFWRT